MLWRYRSALPVYGLLAQPLTDPAAARRLTRSASQALAMALQSRAANGGEVALPAYTCLRVVSAIKAAGLQPRFVDVSLESGLMDTAQLPRQGLVAVIATHLFGLPCDVKALRAAIGPEVLLLEDCALAEGSLLAGQPMGGEGDAAVFSYGKGKNLHLGAGGALHWNVPTAGAQVQPMHVDPTSSAWALRLALLRAARPVQDMELCLTHRARAVGLRAGEPVEPEALCEASLSAAERRCLASALAAASLHLSRQQRQRAVFASLTQRLEQVLPELRLLRSPLTAVEPCSPGLALRVRVREKVLDALSADGIDPLRFYWYSAARVCGRPEDGPNADLLADQLLALPSHEGVDDASIDRMVGILQRCQKSGWL